MSQQTKTFTDSKYSNAAHAQPLQHHHVTPEHKGSQGPHQCQRTVDTPTHFSSMPDTGHHPLQQHAGHRSPPTSAACRTQVTTRYSSMQDTGHHSLQQHAGHRSPLATAACRTQVTTRYSSMQDTGHHSLQQHAGHRSPLATAACRTQVTTRYSSMQDTTDAAHPEAVLDPLTLAQESVVEGRENQRELSMQTLHYLYHS